MSKDISTEELDALANVIKYAKSDNYVEFKTEFDKVVSKRLKDKLDAMKSEFEETLFSKQKDD